ncbi:MAG: ribokinase [Thermoleophilia bacterium]|nr:ribokinase [Thermoleophilia bacterium]
MAPAVTVVGSVNLDLVAFCERLPRQGETVTDAELERVPGGKGANQAVAAARLGADVRLVACVGADEHGRLALAGLEEAGVDLTGVRVVDGEPTGVALILVDRGGENEIVVAPGANRKLTPADARVDGADAVLCQLEVPLETVAAAAEAADGFFCLNAAPARTVPEETLARCELIVANSFELDALGSSPLGGLFALTLGAEGALLLEGGEEVARAAPPAVRAVDGTAAGDAFCACLVVSLLEGRPHAEALRRACAAGAITASRPGAQPSLPTAAEVEAILAPR